MINNKNKYTYKYKYKKIKMYNTKFVHFQAFGICVFDETNVVTEHIYTNPTGMLSPGARQGAP